jgi:hypothetical protein
MVASGAVATIVGAMQAHVGVWLMPVFNKKPAVASIPAIVQQGVTTIFKAMAAQGCLQENHSKGRIAILEETYGRPPSQANLPELPKTQTEPLLLAAAKEQFRDDCAELVDILLSRMYVQSGSGSVKQHSTNTNKNKNKQQ